MNYVVNEFIDVKEINLKMLSIIYKAIFKSKL